MITRVLHDELEGLERRLFKGLSKQMCTNSRKASKNFYDYSWPPKPDNQESSGQKADCYYLTAICTFLDVSLLMFCLLVLQCYMFKLINNKSFQSNKYTPVANVTPSTQGAK
jgi:hypothetical protein